MPVTGRHCCTQSGMTCNWGLIGLEKSTWSIVNGHLRRIHRCGIKKAVREWKIPLRDGRIQDSPLPSPVPLPLYHTPSDPGDHRGEPRVRPGNDQNCILGQPENT